MTGTDSIEFFAKYKDWLCVKRLEVDSSTTNLDVVSWLNSVSSSTGRKAFEVLGVDVESLIPHAKKITEHLKGGTSSIIEAYQRMGSTDSKEAVKKACKGKDEMLPFAQAFLFKAVLNNLNIIDAGMYALKSNYSKDKASGKKANGMTQNEYVSNGKDKTLQEGITFFAKYKNWIAIKKMSIRPDTKPEEVAMQLIAIRNSTDKKSYEIAGISTAIIDEYAVKKTKGMRRSFANLSKIIDIMDSQEAQAKVKESTKSEEANMTARISFADYGLKNKEDLAKEYLFKQLMQNIKFDFEVSPDKLSAMYPGLKLPGRRGRKPKA